MKISTTPVKSEVEIFGILNAFQDLSIMNFSAQNKIYSCQCAELRVMSIFAR